MKIKNSLQFTIEKVTPSVIAILSTFSFSTIAQADTINSRCDIYPRGEDKVSKVVNCTFSQRQGFITIRREDGITYELKPNDPNQYLDQNGASVLRENDGPATIFRFNNESVFVYQGEKAPSSSHSNSSHSTGQTPENLYSTTPPHLKDLVGARAGQAENELISRGYTYRNTVTFEGGKSAYYTENKTGYCVEVGTVEGRYSSIVYNSSDRCAK
ncbi:hypothetical protein [Geminocystis sp. NIES-3709]|uniref:hypothetical protein n=1 Tax=Geminocystis sp. NIES-3709 TaxID=1617448 RepID=UPI0005FC7985|nr:hypothetical protein [Geminocystis sp. NIES-3709]BAQ65422.1 hypothetical protein GM3709_2187 [Geminocystis sp. NIES-3709]